MDEFLNWETVEEPDVCLQEMLQRATPSAYAKYTFNLKKNREGRLRM